MIKYISLSSLACTLAFALGGCSTAAAVGGSQGRSRHGRGDRAESNVSRGPGSAGIAGPLGGICRDSQRGQGRIHRRRRGSARRGL